MAAEGMRPRSPCGYRPLGAGLDLAAPAVRVPEAPPAPARWRFPAPDWGGTPGDTVQVHTFAAPGRRRGTALLVPPWRNAYPWAWRGWVRALTGAGLECWLLVPPLHLGRGLPGQRSGEGYVSPDLPRFAAAVAETAREIRALAASAAPRGPVGLLALSLGGLAAAHALAGLRLSFAALLAPAVDLPAIFAETPLGARFRRLAERAGAPLPEGPALAAALQPLAPGSPPHPDTRLLVAAGHHDAVVPPQGPSRLARAWGVEPRLFQRGHLTLLLACGALRREVAALAREALR